MEALALFAISFLGALAWSVPVAPAAVAYGSELGWNPLVVGLVCTVGQCLGFLVLYFFGAGILGRWKRLAMKVQQARDRHLEWLSRAFLPATLCGAVAGVPPMVALATLAPAFEVRLRPFLMVSAVGRFLRYSVLAGAGQSISIWLGR